MDFSDANTNGSYLKNKITKPEAWGPIFTHVGQEFEGGVQAFRDAIGHYSISTKKSYKFIKNDRYRVTVGCHGDGCPFKVHGYAPMRSPNIFLLKEFNLNHIGCTDFILNSSKAKISSKLVGGLIAEDLKINPNKSTKDVELSFLKDFGLNLSYYFSYKGKKKALSTVFGQEEDSYSKLEWYASAINRTNPDSIVDLEVDSINRRFIRIFICLGACRKGFMHCRPVIYVDGTFAKSKFQGCILAAVAKDGNNGMFPLAYAVVDSENDQNWEWFFKNLHKSVDPNTNYTFMSDRHSGILKGVKGVFPNSLHSFCAWHLKNNLNLRVKNGAKKSGYFQSLLFKAARAVPESEFHKHMASMVHMGGTNVARFFESLNPENWADSFFPGSRYGAISSQLAETFNNWIRDDRVLPITVMLDSIRVRIMKRMNKKRIKAEKWCHFLCPKINIELEYRFNLANSWAIIPSGDLVYEVCSFPTHSVNLIDLKCSCGRWSIDGIPCQHAMLCIKKYEGDTTSFFDPIFTKQAFVNTYQYYVYPIPNYDEPMEYNDATRTLPPLTKRKPGRPRTVRRESSGNIPKKMRVCSRCKKPAYHNSASCTAAI